MFTLLPVSTGKHRLMQFQLVFTDVLHIFFHEVDNFLGWIVCNNNFHEPHCFTRWVIFATSLIFFHWHKQFVSLAF